MRYIKLYEDFVNEAKSVNPKQKGIGKFLGSVKNTDVYAYNVFPVALSSSPEFKEISLDDIDAMQELVYNEFSSMHQTKLNGKPGKLIKKHLSDLAFYKSKKDGSFSKRSSKKEDGGNFDRMVKNSTKDQLLRNFN